MNIHVRANTTLYFIMWVFQGYSSHRLVLHDEAHGYLLPMRLLTFFMKCNIQYFLRKKNKKTHISVPLEYVNSLNESDSCCEEPSVNKYFDYHAVYFAFSGQSYQQCRFARGENKGRHQPNPANPSCYKTHKILGFFCRRSQNIY